MLRSLQVPDQNAIVGTDQVVDVLQGNANAGQFDLRRSVVKGTVTGYHAGKDKNLLDNPIAEQVVTRGSVDFKDLSDGAETYRVWETGRIDPQSGAPPVEEYAPIANYLLEHRWPFPGGLGVSEVNAGSTSVPSQDVSYYTTTGATDFNVVEQEDIRSDDTLRCLVAVEPGSDTLSVSLERRPSGAPNETIQSATKTISPSSWSVASVELDPPGRIPHDGDPIVLSVTAGALTYARPVLRPKRASLAPSAFSLPDGRALIHVSKGTGRTTGADPFVKPTDASFTADLAAGRIFVVGFMWPDAFKERAVVTGEDRSQTHYIERDFAPRVWPQERLPQGSHLPLARLSAT